MQAPQRAAHLGAALVVAMGLTLVGSVSEQAAGATSTIIVDGTAFRPAKLSLARSNCADPVVPTPGAFDVVSMRDDQAPAGDRALSVTTTEQSGGAGPLARIGQPQNVTSLRAAIVSAGDYNDIAAVVRYRPDESESTWWGLAALEGPTGTYGDVEAAASVFTWSRVDAEGKRDASGGQRTLQDFFGSSRTPGVVHAGFLLGCTGGEMRLDALVVAAGDNQRVWNFEGAKPRLSMALRPSTAVFGRSVKVRTRIDSEDRGERLVVVERKTKSGTAEVDRVRLDRGRDSFRMKAKTSGRYRLTLGPTEISESASSEWKRLRVPSKVTAASSTRSLRKGARFTVTGRIAPAASGTVTIQRFAGGRWINAANTRWSGSNYSIKVRANPVGEHAYRARTTGTPANEVGTSPRFRVTVTAPPPPSGGGGGNDSGGGGDTGGGGGGGQEPPEGPQRPSAH